MEKICLITFIIKKDRNEIDGTAREREKDTSFSEIYNRIKHAMKWI